MTSEWLHALRRRADQPPLQPRVALHVDGHASAVGSIEPALAQRLVAAGLPVVASDSRCTVVGVAPDDAFARIAQWLPAQGLGSAWRDELLDVRDLHGTVVARIERAAVRPLGIATHAVHLIGWAEQGGAWVQQRAFDKATDPGQWDTLMGGLVSAGEGTEATLARETWEEAGLRIAALRDVAPVQRITVRRPIDDGYMVEHIQVVEATVPAGLAPSNQDGEVAAFARLDATELEARLRTGAFTLEATLILAEAMHARRRG